MKLFTYFRSSAAYRVRIALNLKGLQPEHIPIHLVNNGGEQFSKEYRTKNPQCLVPALEVEQGVITQSLAILEYCEEKFPTPALLPKDPFDRARVRSLALSIACEIHPLNNLRVLKYLTEQLGLQETQKNTWYQHWIRLGLTALEARLAQDPQTGQCCHGDEPTFADIFLVPQLYNARRFQCDLSDYPTLCRIEEYCGSIPAFQNAAPEKQKDFV
jgi:maleylacetoacetate isomerase